MLRTQKKTKKTNELYDNQTQVVLDGGTSVLLFDGIYAACWCVNSSKTKEEREIFLAQYKLYNSRRMGARTVRPAQTSKSLERRSEAPT